jgi:hypothetical protein
MTTDWFAAVTAGGESGAVARTVDWDATPLGAPDTWPPSLRWAVELCMGTRFPMLVAWGPELIEIYNDGYRDILGSEKHPGAMGRPTRDVWREVWDDIRPLFEQVLETGEATWRQDARLVLHRSGFDEETYFTYSYSPIRDQAGVVRGVLNVTTETTEHVVERRRMRALGELSNALHPVADDVSEVARVTVEHLAQAVDDVLGVDVHFRTEDGRLPLLATNRVLPDGGGADAAVLQQAATGLAPVLGEGVMVAPLLGPSDTVAAGVIVLEANPMRPFDEHNVAFLDLVATSVGSVMSTALRRTREIGRLRQVGASLQAAMLPDISAVPRVAARYLAATGGLAVGGDWYDVVDLGGGQIALIVGDCVGHGLDAAAVMGQLRSASRALLLENHGPAATLEGLDRFARSVDGAECTTVFCGVLDEDAGTFTYASAGHLPPLVVGHGATRWLDDALGVPLAVVPDLVRHEESVDLARVHTLVLYTDGLVERRDEPIDDVLGRLAAVLGQTDPAVPLELVADTVLRELLPHGARDDVALLLHRPAAS